jgi:hypothetical protein
MFDLRYQASRQKADAQKDNGDETESNSCALVRAHRSGMRREPLLGTYRVISSHA